MNEAHSDTGTVLAPSSAALVFTADGNFELLLPDTGKNLPLEIVLLGAVFAKVQNDPGWVQEMVDEFWELPT